MSEKSFTPLVKKAIWLEVMLKHSLGLSDVFLYGSVSKIGPFVSACFDEQSDYDFATADSTFNRSLLENDGWEKLPELDYQDCSTVAIYKKDFEGEKVQVSLRKDLDLFREAWLSVSPDFYWKFLNKRSHRFIGKDNVREYLDQLFFLASGSYKTKSNQKEVAVDAF